MASFTERMLGAAKLDIATYEELEADESATSQAAGVVAMVAVATAIGAIGGDSADVIGGLLGALLGWVIWAGITYFIGATVFKGTATWGELARTLGFAQTPALLNVFGFIPLLGGLLRFVLGLWVLVAGIVAIRQALDITTGKAILVAIIGWLVLMIPLWLLGIGYIIAR